ncbi:hypothetical protein CEB3_c31370 [Peptococcaceae bacterium CEB3]|nr:hypothetical protein CEB3_c31370 [Peptococcaceae bacterium CEB3]
MSSNETVLVKEGLDMIFDKFGLVKGEEFIAALQKLADFDYTAWRQDKLESLSLEELHEKASKYSQSIADKK